MGGTQVVQIEPVSLTSAEDYLRDTATTARWEEKRQPVQVALRTYGRPVAQALSTPLMLYLARVVFEDRHRDPAELLAPRLVTREAVEAELLESYIPAAYATRAHRRPCDRVQRAVRRGWRRALAAAPSGFSRREPHHGAEVVDARRPGSARARRPTSWWNWRAWSIAAGAGHPALPFPPGVPVVGADDDVLGNPTDRRPIPARPRGRRSAEHDRRHSRLDPHRGCVERVLECRNNTNTQANWRRCHLCSALFWTGTTSWTAGIRPTGAQHDPFDSHNNISFQYLLPHDIGEPDRAQHQWRFCFKCSALFYNGYAYKNGFGLCPYDHIWGRRVSSGRGRRVRRVVRSLGHEVAGGCAASRDGSRQHLCPHPYQFSPPRSPTPVATRPVRSPPIATSQPELDPVLVGVA